MKFSLAASACVSCLFFFFNDTATTEIYTLSLHDALPILCGRSRHGPRSDRTGRARTRMRSEEHTSELQSRLHLVCRLLLEKKKQEYIHMKHGHESVSYAYGAVPVTRT